MSKKIAVLITDEFEDSEFTSPAAEFRQAGHEVPVGRGMNAREAFCLFPKWRGGRILPLLRRRPVVGSEGRKLKSPSRRC